MKIHQREDGKVEYIFEDNKELRDYISRLPDKPCDIDFGKIVNFYFPLDFPWAIKYGRH